MKTLTSTLYLFFSIILCLVALLGCSGVTVDLCQKETSQDLAENERLKQELQAQKELTSELQYHLLKKHDELNRLSARSKSLLHSITQPDNRNRKVEVVRMLAEVTAVVDSVKADIVSQDVDKFVLAQAKSYHLQSQKELENQY